jgi:hypothetical protein
VPVPIVPSVVIEDDPVQLDRLLICEVVCVWLAAA